MGFHGMMNVALRPAGALRYIVLIPVTTKWSFFQPNRAQVYARSCSVSLSHFLSVRLLI